MMKFFFDGLEIEDEVLKNFDTISRRRRGCFELGNW